MSYAEERLTAAIYIFRVVRTGSSLQTMGAGQGRYVSDQEGGSTEGIIGTPLRGSIDTASASSPLPATTAGASVAPPATSPQRRSSQRLQQECGRRVRARSTPVVRVKDTSDNTDRNRENAADGHLRGVRNTCLRLEDHRLSPHA